MAGLTSAVTSQSPMNNHPPTVAVPWSERARRREIASYLEAASIGPSTAQLEGDGIRYPLRSPDTNFTALVQLGLFRLDCERSFFSLIDGKTQYMVAEATRKTSLSYGSGSLAQKDLMLGTMLMDKSWGVCPRTMDFFTDKSGTLVSTDANIVADREKYIIKDFLADDGFKNRPYVTDWPHMRSYAEVPVTSPSGHVIGGYCSVVDTKPRHFSDDEIKMLAEVGRTIMAHLEHVRVRNHQTRSERLVRSLDTFIQEEASSSDAERDGAASISSLPNRPTKDDKIVKADSASNDMKKTTAEMEQLTGTEQTNRQHEDEKRINATKFSHIPGRILRTFQRATALICDSLSISGFAFVDASALGHSLNTSHFNTEPSPVGQLSGSAASSTSCPLISEKQFMSSDDKAGVKLFPVRLLERLTQRFPRGQLFFADEHGAISLANPSADGEIKADIDEDLNEVFHHIPQARSVVFLPLWHAQRERWFAAAIGWNCSPIHTLNSSDLTYLSAFCNSIMVEVLKHEALIVSKAKSDFIHSISHEIRSPLHGILATAEILSEMVRIDERTMLNMIQSCGTTLLDTMNHIFEYAKINSLSSTQSMAALNRSHSVADLAHIVEDVTESVAAGHAFESDPYQPSKQISLSAEQEFDIPVLVMLEIQACTTWKMSLDIGAWKRIVMNLVGNALKYTKKGHVKVKLAMAQQRIYFSVQDTGIGISADYLKYRLFTPFAQEDNLSQGTGLGLYIIQQIVKGLGGKLDVQSEVGVGTTVSVSVPYLSDPANLSSSDSMESCYNGEDMKLCIVTSALPPLPKNKDADYKNYRQSLITSVASIAAESLRMQVIHSDSTDLAEADVYLIDATLSSQPMAAVPASLSSKPILLITDLRSWHSLNGPLTKGLKVPLGPRQLAKVLFSLSQTPSPVPSQITQEVSRRESNHQENIVSSFPSDNSTLTVRTKSSEPPKINNDSLPTVFPSFAPHLERRSASSKHHILAVDDNNINLKILTKLLEALGSSYSTAINGREAVQQVKDSVEKPFTLVLMDLSMPIMDGFQATQEIRKCESERDGTVPLKIIALTGLGDARSKGEAFAAGLNDFWIKPIKIAKLRELMLEYP